jgi:O-acetyl-ADP-ribose deacetylase (regulator of RNase III)
MRLSMNRHDQLVFLVKYLLRENSAADRYALSGSEADDGLDASSDEELFSLFRSLVNIRPAQTLPAEAEIIQNDFLRGEIAASGITDAAELKEETSYAGTISQSLSIWKGDITRLKADAIVNAANSALLGCRHPLHPCIDNVIHTYSGVQLRLACSRIMKEQGHEEPTGSAKITPAFNLPSRFVIHTVGPIIRGPLTLHDEELLSDCYRSCLDCADEHGCRSVAFCCISTGEFHFPNRRAAEIAIASVLDWCRHRPDSSVRKIIFNVFKDIDHEIYTDLIS